MQYQEMLRDVAQRARVDDEQAATAIAATLSVLAERIDHGEREDLAPQLPLELKELVAGRTGAGTRVSLMEFLHAVAERASVTPEKARSCALAVLHTLRDAVGRGEMSDLFAQLPAVPRGVGATTPLTTLQRAYPCSRRTTPAAVRTYGRQL